MPYSSDDRDYFALRFYQWSFGKLLEDIATGFERFIEPPLYSHFSLAALNQTPVSERKDTAISRLKFSHRRGAELSGDPLSAKDDALLRQFDALRTQLHHRTLLGRLLQARPGAARMRRLLVKQLKEELPDALGLPPEDEVDPSRLWFYRNQVKGHLVITSCDAEASAKQFDFGFGHRIREKEDGDILHYDANWLSWLGIFPHTHWVLSNEDEIPLVVKNAKDAAREFLGALPEMLPNAPAVSGRADGR